MAGNPRNRKRFSTDRRLLDLASNVPLRPAPDRAVFYAEDEGASLAAKFIAANPAYTRLDELLQASSDGRRLWSALTAKGRPWSDVEEVWWELSWRLARAAKGHVHVFGPARLVEDRSLSEFRHKYTTGAYANSVFEKVELPELEQNPAVTRITYNGQAFG